MNNLQICNNKQCGLTIIELVIAIAIVSIIGASVVTLISLLYESTNSTSDLVTVQNHVKNAISLISKDARMAQHITIDDNISHDTLVTFEWVVWKDEDNIRNVVTYLINNKQELERRYILTHSNSGYVEEGSTVIAQYIDSSLTRCVYDSSSNLMEFNITSSKTFYRSVNATSIVKVVPRVLL